MAELRGLKGQVEGKDIHIATFATCMISYANYIETTTRAEPCHRIPYLQSWYPLIKIILNKFIIELRNWENTKK